MEGLTPKEQMAIVERQAEDEEMEEEYYEDEAAQNPSCPLEWEARAREWLTAILSESRPVTMSEVEGWVSSNRSIFPADLLSLTQAELLGRFSAIQSSLLHEQQAAKQSNPGENPARFQRTNQWLPVYSWLESLDADEVINSKDIVDWLAQNPKIHQELSAKHSRYHMMHYIKKCHVKILKKKGKFQGNLQPNWETSPQLQAAEVPRLPAPVPYNSPSNVPKGSDLHATKRNEAMRKYEILVELEKQLAAVIQKHSKK